MTEEEVLKAIAEGNSAYWLLRDTQPNIERRWKRVCKSIITLLEDVQKDFPDAQYYTASGGFTLMLGRPHAEHSYGQGKPQQELIALNSFGAVTIGDGDF